MANDNLAGTLCTFKEQSNILYFKRLYTIKLTLMRNVRKSANYKIVMKKACVTFNIFITTVLFRFTTILNLPNMLMV